ncbi:MAG: alpha/beta hydrolase [Lentisphaeria bacterium]|nr:alpha/beta hydrolase [Lentisphaeria bacterium]NQZ66853.1 alpha/beta hydrolase [Lentisphaeria bacterium]
MSTIYGNLEASTTDASPQIDCYIAEKNDQAIAVIIFPGGGYGKLAAHEGSDYAEFFNAHNISAFVVKYRLGTEGYKHPAMLEDALAAIETVRKSADEFGINSNKIGIMGSSAGGHLVSHAMTAYDRYKSSVSLRPDFAILCYPVITMSGEFIHMGSRTNLIGDNPTEDLIHEVNSLAHVTADTPPAFIWHTWEDQSVPVENAILFASALRKHNVKLELHIYEKGSHGLALNADFSWSQDCLRWIKLQFS